MLIEVIGKISKEQRLHVHCKQQRPNESAEINIQELDEFSVEIEKVIRGKKSAASSDTSAKGTSMGAFWKIATKRNDHEISIFFIE